MIHVHSALFPYAPGPSEITPYTFSRVIGVLSALHVDAAGSLVGPYTARNPAPSPAVLASEVKRIETAPDSALTGEGRLLPEKAPSSAHSHPGGGVDGGRVVCGACVPETPQERASYASMYTFPAPTSTLHTDTCRLPSLYRAVEPEGSELESVNVV
eukprot:191785-Rhodomonas_salina.1